jgi:hypothetical protein
MTTPVCARVASFEHTGTEPGLQPFHGPKSNIVLQKHKVWFLYTYRARWGVSGALLPAIRYSGVDAYLRLEHVRSALQKRALTIGSCAMGTYESGQIRKEAAISRLFHVPQGSLVRAPFCK